MDGSSFQFSLSRISSLHRRIVKWEMTVLAVESREARRLLRTLLDRLDLLCCMRLGTMAEHALKALFRSPYLRNIWTAKQERAIIGRRPFGTEPYSAAAATAPTDTANAPSDASSAGVTAAAAAILQAGASSDEKRSVETTKPTAAADAASTAVPEPVLAAGASAPDPASSGAASATAATAAGPNAWYLHSARRVRRPQSGSVRTFSWRWPDLSTAHLRPPAASKLTPGMKVELLALDSLPPTSRFANASVVRGVLRTIDTANDYCCVTLTTALCAATAPATVTSTAGSGAATDSTTAAAGAASKSEESPQTEEWEGSISEIGEEKLTAEEIELAAVSVLQAPEASVTPADGSQK
jgi:hypothetical protein